MEAQVKLRDDRIVQLLDIQQRIQAELEKEKQIHEREVQRLKKEYQMKKMDTNRKIVQLQTMINELNAATNKILFSKAENPQKITN